MRMTRFGKQKQPALYWDPNVICDGHRAADRAAWVIKNFHCSLQEARERIMNEFPKVFEGRLFHSCYYINLDRSPHRLKHVEKLYGQLFNNLKRISAVDGNQLETPNKISKVDSKAMTRYEMACTMSHMKAIKQAYDDGLAEVLIMEDDMFIDFITKWDISLKTIISNAPKDTECIQLHCINGDAINKMIQYKTRFCNWHCDNYSTGCYYINRKGMKKLLELSEDQYDKADNFIYNNIKTYTYTRPLFNHQANESTIQSAEELDLVHKMALDAIKTYFNQTN